MKLFGREPAVILNLFAACVMMASAFGLSLSDTQQGALNAVAVGVVGLIVAILARSGDVLALVGGLVQAAIACALAFGLDLSPDLQASIMVFVTAAGAAFIRQQVTPPVDDVDAPVGPRHQLHA